MTIESGQQGSPRGRPRPADDRRETIAYRMWLPPLTDPTPVSELIARDYRASTAADRAGYHGRAAPAPAGGVGHRRLDGGRQHRSRRRPADRQVDVSADVRAGGRGVAYATSDSVLLRRHRRRRPDVRRGAAARRRGRHPCGARPCQSRGRRSESRYAATGADIQAVSGSARWQTTGRCATTRTTRHRRTRSAMCSWSSTGGRRSSAEFPDLEAVVQDIAGQGLAYGVHTVISTPRWTELRARVRDYLEHQGGVPTR